MRREGEAHKIPVGMTNIDACLTEVTDRATRKVVFPVQGWFEGSWGFCPGWRVLWLAESGGARLPVTVGSNYVAVACGG